MHTYIHITILNNIVMYIYLTNNSSQQSMIFPLVTVGNVWRYFWFSQLGWHCWHVMGRYQRCAEHPIIHKTVCTQRNYLVQNVNSAEVKKPVLDILRNAAVTVEVKIEYVDKCFICQLNCHLKDNSKMEI